MSMKYGVATAGKPVCYCVHLSSPCKRIETLDTPRCMQALRLGVQHTIAMSRGGVHDMQGLSIGPWQEGVSRYPELYLVHDLIVPNLEMRFLVLPQAATAEAPLNSGQML